MMLVKGTYVNYVKPGLWPWLVIAAAVLVVLGVTGVVHELRHKERSITSRAQHHVLLGRTWVTRTARLPYIKGKLAGYISTRRIPFDSHFIADQ